MHLRQWAPKNRTPGQVFGPGCPHVGAVIVSRSITLGRLMGPLDNLISDVAFILVDANDDSSLGGRWPGVYLFSLAPEDIFRTFFFMKRVLTQNNSSVVTLDGRQLWLKGLIEKHPEGSPIGKIGSILHLGQWRSVCYQFVTLWPTE